MVALVLSEAAGYAPTFEPAKHLAYKQPPNVLIMSDLGYTEDEGVSKVAVSEAFELFTPEAIQIMRAEIAQPDVHKKHMFSSNIAASQLRGYAKE